MFPNPPSKANSGDALNPLLTADGRLLSVGNFAASGLTVALDYMRLALAQVITLSCERVQKLLSQGHTDLPTGLFPHLQQVMPPSPI